LPFDRLLFYVFGAAAVLSSLFVIGQGNPIYSVVFLIGSFAALSGLYILLDATFVAVIQIIIYAGAIMVLFLFVVMLLNAPQEDEPGEHVVPVSPGARVAGGALALALILELVWAVGRSEGGTTAPAGETSIRTIGVRLFEDYAFAFEATSILILVAMVGAVVLAHRAGDQWR
jgi:NADH-quinone oxidoreductase subunit J